ncbi:hypothetical protein A2U01_0063556 [Trifolium medium]|uniref:Uncharacterized protein n=1 Tax=Trifolium medium TaxID=97028 RepID=A0A392S0Y8_9FABA|nr:hypothetical protein [Trifolium medium]
MRAQEEQRAAASASAAAAASHGSPFFILGELGIDDSPGFQNFMDPSASG